MNYESFYESCTLCPRECKVNRNKGVKGYCRSDSRLKVARAALHFWEEPCISGERGSGAVFFSGCNMGCVFCQNQSISHGDAGFHISIERLADIFLELQDQGAHNINLVTPDHFVPSIREAILIAKSKGLKLPLICNCSGYMKPELIQMFHGLVDIWLPDFKYFDDTLAFKYSKASGYRQIAMSAIEEMYRQCPEAVFDEDGMMQKGIIVRHLILPGAEEDSMKLIGYLYRTYGDQIYQSIMNQFTPLPHLMPDYPELNKKIDDNVYDQIIDHAIDLGLENGFIQEGETASDSFIPSFDGEGVL